MSDLMLDVGQANELKMAFRRANWTNDDIKWLCEGNVLSEVLRIRHGVVPAVIKSSASFPVWKTLTIGTGLTDAKAFSTALGRMNCYVGDFPVRILNWMLIAKEPTTLDLVRLSVAELGCKDGAYLKDIYTRANKLGLALCPAEVGPQLRLAYLDQPFNESLAIAMHPMDSNGHLFIFHVERKGNAFYLDSYTGEATCLWHPAQCFIFVRR